MSNRKNLNRAHEEFNQAAQEFRLAEEIYAKSVQHLNDRLLNKIQLHRETITNSLRKHYGVTASAYNINSFNKEYHWALLGQGKLSIESLDSHTIVLAYRNNKEERTATYRIYRSQLSQSTWQIAKKIRDEHKAAKAQAHEQRKKEINEEISLLKNKLKAEESRLKALLKKEGK